jgi:hypothetical protein
MRLCVKQFNHYAGDLQLDEVEIDKGRYQDIWEKLQTYLPLYNFYFNCTENSER